MAKKLRITSDARFVVTSPAEITWAEEDNNWIEFQNDIDNLTIQASTPYNPAFNYLGGVTYIVGYAGQPYKYISGSNHVGITPGTDATVWQLLPGSVIHYPIDVSLGGTGLASIPIYKILYASAANTLSSTTNIWYNGATFTVGGVVTPLATAAFEVQGGFTIRQGLGTYSQTFIDSASGAARGQFVLVTSTSDFVYYRMVGGAGAEASLESLRINNSYGTCVSTVSSQYNFVCNVLSGFVANNYPLTGIYNNSCGGIGVVGSDGGLLFSGFASNGGASFPLLFDGYWTGTTPASGYGAIVFRSFKNNGSNVRTALASAEIAFQFRNNTTILMTGLGGGQISVGTGIAPTAMFHLPAGTSAASTSPLKFTTGVSLTSPESGAMEFTTPDLFFTTGARYNIPLVSGAGVQGDINYCSAASVYSRLAKNTSATRYLSNTGPSNNPAWAQVDLSNGVTGVLPLANGGHIISSSRFTAQTAAKTLTVVNVPAADSSFYVSANVLVTTSTVHSFTATIAYTDEGNTARTITIQFNTLAGALITAMTNAQGTVPYSSIPVHIRCKASTTITVATVGTFTTVTYNVENTVVQIR